jgi:hypothetical protein
VLKEPTMHHNRMIFSDEGHPDVRPKASDVAAAALYAITLLVSCLAWGYAVDHHDEVERAYEAGQVAGRQAMADTVGDAYGQGRRDALFELKAAGGQCPAQAAPVARKPGGVQ